MHFWHSIYIFVKWSEYIAKADIIFHIYLLLCNNHISDVLFCILRFHIDFCIKSHICFHFHCKRLRYSKQIHKSVLKIHRFICIVLTERLTHFYFILSSAWKNIFNRTIKLSSPKLSNITAFGCILVYGAVILLGLDYSTLPANEKAFPIVCTVSYDIN